jgi:molecular chaperone DnaK
MSKDNKQLGVFHLDGIPPAPRGVPQVEVTFDIDANGILHVSAKDLGTGKEQKISITGSSGLSKDEVTRMTKEAEQFAEADRQAKEGIELKNNADNAAYQAEKLLKEHADKIDAAKKTEVEAATAKLREALKGTDNDALKAALESLNEKVQAISIEMYKAAAAAQAGAEGADPGAAAGPGPKPSEAKKADGDVIDADFEMVDKDKDKPKK